MKIQNHESAVNVDITKELLAFPVFEISVENIPTDHLEPRKTFFPDVFM